jgi:hypothetical protein
MSTEHDASRTAELPEERITLRMPVDTDAPSHGIVLREGPKPTRVRGRIPRIARLLALAHHFQELLDLRAAIREYLLHYNEERTIRGSYAGSAWAACCASIIARQLENVSSEFPHITRQDGAANGRPTFEH